MVDELLDILVGLVIKGTAPLLKIELIYKLALFIRLFLCKLTLKSPGI